MRWARPLRSASLAVGAALALTILTACGGGKEEVDTSPITTGDKGDLVCGALPRAAVVKAVGTSELRVDQGRERLSEMRSSVTAACAVKGDSDGRPLLLDVAFSSVSAGDNRLALEQFSQGHSSSVRTLPADLGRGLLKAPWTKDSPSAQVTMMNGRYRLQITLQRAPAQRDQTEDVVALARLLKPYFPGS